MLLSATVLFAALNTASAECPNACSAHGKCGAYDMCTCYRNWMANDCSERICQFGLAHVDTPKGDLDSSSGSLTGPSVTVADNNAMYPDGTTEQFPNMADSDQATLTNTAHYYMECANKGLCDRQSGECQCYDGYGGSACQRAECPDTGNGVCSGHGTCQNIKTISAWDNGNIYKLWDESATMGCACDGGYTGANCEEKICKYGADPLYQDSFQTIRYSNWTYSIYTTAFANVTGNYSLVFSDSGGEDWSTTPIDYAATCATVVATLEAIPNNVIPADTTLCTKWAADTLYDGGAVYEPVDTSATTMHAKYTLAFPSNPGKLDNLQINTHLDGSRTTLYTDEATSSLNWYIFNNGFYGEDDDMVPDLCSGVLVNFGRSQTGTSEWYDFLDGVSTTETALLKACLGDANGDTSDNAVSEVENWDWGDHSNPHLIKLIDATQDDLEYSDTDPTHWIPSKVQLSYLCAQGVDTNFEAMCDRSDPPGFYAAIYWDDALSKFKVYGRPFNDYTVDTNFHVYTTTGYLQLVDTQTVAFNTWDDSSNQLDELLTNKIHTLATNGNSRDGLDCETSTSGLECLQKGDYMMVIQTGQNWATTTTSSGYQILNSVRHASNAIYPQIYEVKKISNEPIPEADYATTYGYTWADTSNIPSFVRNQIVTDKAFNVNFHLSTITPLADSSAAVFKFYPPSDKYGYAGQCANRGICDTDAGLCNCFAGFTNDNCDTIDALAA